jgi:hypothetical protein
MSDERPRNNNRRAERDWSTPLRRNRNIIPPYLFNPVDHGDRRRRLDMENEQIINAARFRHRINEIGRAAQAGRDARLRARADAHREYVRRAQERADAYAQGEFDELMRQHIGNVPAAMENLRNMFPEPERDPFFDMDNPFEHMNRDPNAFRPGGFDEMLNRAYGPAQHVNVGGGGGLRGNLAIGNNTLEFFKIPEKLRGSMYHRSGLGHVHNLSRGEILRIGNPLGLAERGKIVVM